MERPTLEPGELVIVEDGVQLARGFPQTAGQLFLTNRRLVLLPSQFLSLWCGRVLEIPLERIVSIEGLGRFEGGTIVGSAGRKIAVRLDDGTKHTFSFFLDADPDAFHSALAQRVGGAGDPGPAEGGVSGERRTWPRPRWKWWFWTSVALSTAGVVVVCLALIGLVRKW